MNNKIQLNRIPEGIYSSHILGNKGKCWYCGAEGRMTKDHFFPKSKDGRLRVYACEVCNKSKGSLTPLQWIFKLQTNLKRQSPESIIGRANIERIARMIRATESLWNKVAWSVVPRIDINCYNKNCSYNNQRDSRCLHSSPVILLNFKNHNQRECLSIIEK